MARAAIVALVALALLAPAASAQSPLKTTLGHAMAGAGTGSSAYVYDTHSRAIVYSKRATTARALASNTKLFTSAAVLGKLGATTRLATSLAGTGTLAANGTWTGNLYLRGGGDPTFGDSSYSRSLLSGASVDTIAATLAAAGFKRVKGRVFGDESLFDSLRGVPDSRWSTSPWVGPLSALDFDHTSSSSPASRAAQQLTAALKRARIGVGGKPGVHVTPTGAFALTEVRSPTVGTLLRLQNKPSSNFFAEMLAKGLSVDRRAGGAARRAGTAVPQPPRPGQQPVAKVGPFLAPASTTAGTRVAMRFARTFGATPHLVDGSGLSRPDRASPLSVVRLLDGMRRRRDFKTFYNSLPIAGRDGTLVNRMRSGAARGRCHAKTGTLTGVSALSGYCTTRTGRTVEFSVLNTGLSLSRAHAIQDRVANAIAGSS